MICPVPLRGSMRSTATASSSDATTLSMPKIAMCTGGSVVVRSALPSLVTSTMVPVSAIARLAPLIPTAAVMNFCRNDSRAWAWIASTVGSVPNTRAASSLVRWIAGAMRCDGCVCVSCTIRSPRSVSTTSMPRDSSPSVKRSTSSGSFSRLARRRRFRSAWPAAKSKVSKAALRRLLSPVIAWINAPCSLGSSRALLTRRAKWRLDSGTRLACFLDRLADRVWCRHRGQAYGPDAHHCASIVIGFDHRVRMRQQRRAGQLGIAGAHFDCVLQPIERAREDRSHEAVLPRQRCHRFEGSRRPGRVRLVGIAQQDVELYQRDRRDRVLDQRLDAIAQAAELVGPGVVEVAAQLRIRVASLEMFGYVPSLRKPVTVQARLVRADGRPQSPDLVGQLPGSALGVRQPGAVTVAVFEEAVQQRGGVLAQGGPLAADGRIEVRDRKGRVPRRVNAAVHVRSARLRTTARIERVVVLVGVLAAGVQAGCGIAKDPVEVTSGQIERVAQPGEGEPIHQAGVVLEHLLEMRNAPVLRGRVAEEPALDVVVGAACGHSVERVLRHGAQLLVPAQLRLLEQKEDGIGLRKLGRGSEATVFRVVSILDGTKDGVDDRVVERTRAARNA